MPGKHYRCSNAECCKPIDMVRQCAFQKCGHEIGYCAPCGGDERAMAEMIAHHAEHRVPITKRADGAYVAGPPPDGRSVDEHLNELAKGKP